MLDVYDSIPDGLLELSASQLHEKLNNPTLIHLQGRRQRPMFLSTLLHGNEHTSWDATRLLLAKYQDQTLPRSLSVFIGNVSAAKYDRRYLDHQSDFNRIWGSEVQRPHPLMQKVLDEMLARNMFLSVDVHNNTGKNPHYACVNSTANEFLYLASLFSRNIVYFLKPEGVQSMAFSKHCPSVTVECGLSGQSSGTEHVYDFLQACLNLSEFPENTITNKDIGIYHTMAVARLVEGLSLAVEPSETDVCLFKHIEKYNFSKLSAGTGIAKVRNGIRKPFQVINETGEDVTPMYFEQDDDIIKLSREVIPAMFTLDIETIHKDCLCYFMEEYQI